MLKNIFQNIEEIKIGFRKCISKYETVLWWNWIHPVYFGFFIFFYDKIKSWSTV